MPPKPKKSQKMRDFANLIEVEESAEEEYAQAQEDYQANPEDEQAKDEYHYAAEQLREARSQSRLFDVPAPVPEGSAVVVPGAVTPGSSKKVPKDGGE